MNRKGFTLIELLAVIIILALLALLTSNAITKMLKDSKEELSSTQIKLIESAARSWGAENMSSLPPINSCSYITLKDLKEYGLLNSSVIDPNTNKEISDDLKIKIATKPSKSGNPITTYEVNPESMSGCLKAIQSKEEMILKGSTPTLDGEQFVPVIYDGNNWKIADESDKWYDYDNQWWANAVILSKDAANKKKVGDSITVDGDSPDALAMLVWIPRYEYKIEGEFGKGGTSADLPGEIEVNFISKDTTTPSDGYRIHPAFTFGDKELSGIWVGKFETSSNPNLVSENSLGCSDENCTNADKLRILPNVVSLRNNNVSNFFFASRSMSRDNNPFGIDKKTIDTHMMKNSEWGAVAYLSQSKYGKYGNKDYTGAQKEVYINNSSSYYTGRSGGNPGGSTPINGTYTDQTSTTTYNSYGFYTYDGYLLSYNTNNKTETRDMNKGTGASTTGNIYGIYDMSGGAWEYVIGVFTNFNGDLWSGNSTTNNSGFTGKVGTSGDDFTGITFPNPKYYDVYKANSGTTINENTACNGGICYGHAISETKNWYKDYAYMVSSSFPWFRRGGHCSSTASAGLFGRYYNGGNSRSNGSFRLVLSQTT